MPHPVLVVSWLPLSLHCAISRAFLTSEWQVKAKRLLVWWLNESIVHLFQTVSSPCGYKQETSRSGSPWWSRWSPRVPGSARPPGTTADRTKTPVCLPTPGTTSEVSLWCHRFALHHCEPKRCSMCSGFFLQVTALNAKIFLKARSVWFVLTCDSRFDFALLDVSVCCRMCSC